MDKLESLSNTLSQITLYDIKAMYNQAKNVVLNVSEMEAKVREATNDEPWGASSTLMQEIAQGTFNFQQFNEIMPCIFARFMEKEARQWRQIYKALQLLEYLIKHGSERVVDDARSNISTIKMLRNFHYIDEKGKDEGLNVRNRARELVELLSDVEKIRAERRRAKANKHKYVGTGNDGFGGMSLSSGGGRYGGFGSDSWGYGGSGSGDREYGSYGGSGGFRDDTRRGGYEEYNAGDDEDIGPKRSASLHAPSRTTTAATTSSKAKDPVPAPVQEVDLLGGFGNDDAFGGTSTSTATANGAVLATNKALPALGGTAPAVSLDDDDFTDFQAAPVSPTTTTMATTTTTTNMTAPPVANAKPNLMEMLNSVPTRQSTIAQQPATQPQPAFGNMNITAGMGRGMGVMNAGAGYGHRQAASGSFGTAMTPTQPQNLFGAAPMKTSPTMMSPTRSTIMTPVTTSTATTTPTTSTSKPGSSFDDLWSMSLGTSTANPAGGAGQGRSIKDLEREKSMARLWGGARKPPGAGTGTTSFGSFGSAGTTSSSGGGGDLLL